MNTASVREYIERKERAIKEIQKGIGEKAKAIEEKKAVLAAGVEEIERQMEKFKHEWYG